ncbi:MAG: cation:proton antiporter [Nitrososphaerales archaeon]
MLPLVFGLVAIIIFFAFTSGYASRKTGLPEIIFLMLLGVLVGPILQLVKVEDLAPIAPFVSSLAVTLILFDSGLKMDLVNAIKESGRAILLGILGFVFSMLSTAVYTIIFLNWELIQGLIIGCVIGGTSSIIVIPMLNRLSVNRRVSTILSLESVVTDVLVIVCALGLLKIWSGTQSEGLAGLAKNLFDSFALGGVIGVAGGLIWLRMLNTFKEDDYNGILTLGVVLGLYSVSEIMSASGAIAALAFGLILGNGMLISKKLKLNLDRQLDRVSLGFHEQITFLLKSVVFVYLGIILSLINLNNLILGVGLAFILLLVRWLAVYLTSIGDPILSLDRSIMTFMIPRGLTAAAVAQLVVAQGLPNIQTFNDIYISIILSTIVISIVGTRLPKVSIPFTLRLKIPINIPKIVKTKEASKQNIIQRLDNEEEQHYLLRQHAAKCILNNKKDEGSIALSEAPKSWNFQPDLYFKYHSYAVAVEVLSSIQPLNEKKLVSEINSWVERYSQNNFDGILKIVLDDLTVLRNLRTLHLLNRYYELTEATRGFHVDLEALDPSKRRLVPINEIIRFVSKKQQQPLQSISAIESEE